MFGLIESRGFQGFSPGEALRRDGDQVDLHDKHASYVLA